MRVSRIALFGLLVALGVQPLAAQQDYSSSATPSVSNGFGAFPGSGWVVGQSFTASGSTLNAFGFYAASNWTGNATFQAILYGMSGSSISGNALYTSSVLNYTSISTGWLDFLTGGVGLTAGNVYMALLAPVSVTGGMAVMDLGTVGDSYAGGAAYTWANLPVTDPSMQAASWNALGSLTGISGQDLALRVDYAVAATQGGDPFEELGPTTTAPEPASMALVATGLIGLMGAGRVRRKRLG